MPVRVNKPGQPVPSVADFSVGGLINAAPAAIGSAVGELPSARAAIRELLNLIKGGAKKDPAKIFLAERSTGPRVPIGNTPKLPPGFEFPKTMAPRRSSIINRNAKIWQDYGKDVLGKGQDPRYRSQAEIVQKEMAPAVRGLEDIVATNLKSTVGHRIQAPLLRKGTGHNLGRTTKYEPSLRHAVEKDVKAGMTSAELRKKYPNVNPNTLSSWKFGG